MNRLGKNSKRSFLLLENYVNWMDKANKYYNCIRNYECLKSLRNREERETEYMNRIIKKN